MNVLIVTSSRRNILLRFPLTILAIAALMAVFAVPLSAQAYSQVQYANNLSRAEYQRATSGTTNIEGGRGFVSGTHYALYINVETVDPVRGTRLFITSSGHGAQHRFITGSSPTLGATASGAGKAAVAQIH